MNKAKIRNASRDLVGEVHLARIRLAGAESEWKSARLESRLAKRKRREAKEAARRAKKRVKLAKAKVLEAKETLAKAEAKLFKDGERAAKVRKAAGRKNRKVRTTKNTAQSDLTQTAPASSPTKPKVNDDVLPTNPGESLGVVEPTQPQPL